MYQLMNLWSYNIYAVHGLEILNSWLIRTFNVLIKSYLFMFKRK